MRLSASMLGSTLMVLVLSAPPLPATAQPEAQFVNGSGQRVTLGPYRPEGDLRAAQTADLWVAVAAVASRIMAARDGSQPMPSLALEPGEQATFRMVFAEAGQESASAAWDHYLLQVQVQDQATPFAVIFTGAVLNPGAEESQREVAAEIGAHTFFDAAGQSVSWPGSGSGAPRPRLESETSARLVFRGYGMP